MRSKTKIEELKSAALEGDVSAAKSLALLYEVGLEVDYNPKEAVLYWEKAADQGDPTALQSLKRIYQSGPHDVKNDGRLQQVESKLIELGYKTESQLQDRLRGKVAGKKRVLIVDDDLGIQELFTRIFEKYGLFDIEVASNGVDAVKQLVAMNGADLVLCDLRMPKMNGLQFVKILREQLSFDVPIVVISGVSEFEKIAKELQKHNVTDVLSKPVRAAQIRAVIEKHLL